MAGSLSSALLMMGMAAAQPLPAPLLALDFDRLAQGELPAGTKIHTQFRRPDVVLGVIGSAWRTDGFSSYAQAALPLDAKAGSTLTLWVALESFPSDLEVPVNELSPSSIAQQWQGGHGGQGFDLHIDTFGRWGFRIATSAGVLELPAPQRFPLRRWVKLAVSVDPAAGVVSLYQDDALLGTATGKPGMSLRLADVPLTLATPAVEARILDFKVNRLNAAYDQVAVYPAALTADQLKQLPAPARVPDAEASLVVPASRFAADFQRPRVHAMPPANWTNEPHGLIRIDGTWHLFYQRTPNGPYKTQMHWGHMASADLVTWRNLPDALWPELQSADAGFDQKGIWSGHVIADGGKAFAFYTSVNHGDRLAAANPGVAMAVSEDPELRHWRKLGPVLNSEGLRDFRDPFLWKEGEGRDAIWHMLVGAALEGGGGLQHYVLDRKDERPRWKPQRLIDTAWRLLDIGSEIWEMPVFEPLGDGVWVLLANPIGGQVSKYGEPATRAVYWTGTWSGGLFKPFDRTPKPLDLLPGHLAPTVGRADDGGLRAIGIVDERRTPAAQLRAGWAHTFSLPRAWTLLPDRRTLGQAPAPELRALRGEARLADTRVALDGKPRTVGSGLQAYELQIELDDDTPVTVELMASEDGRETTRLRFDPAQGSVAVDKSRSSLSGEDEGPPQLQGRFDREAFGAMRTLRVFVDGSVVDVFVNDAAAYALRSYPSLPGSTQVRLSSAQPAAARVQIWPLRPPPR